jgi:hypothetical protein
MTRADAADVDIWVNRKPLTGRTISAALKGKDYGEVILRRTIVKSMVLGRTISASVKMWQMGRRCCRFSDGYGDEVRTDVERDCENVHL